MSLYRKYRPQSFADVAGQDHIVTTLQQAVAQDKLSHAYLFSGTRGTGKTSVARILAKIFLTRGITDPLLKEQIEKAAEEGSLVDLVEIDAASNTGVDNIRDLIEKIQFSPLVAGAKVYIIDEVHMLSKGAFNALLKTLEEPPAYAYFILATTELHKIPATIQSRCQRFLFRQIREEDIVGRLRFIATQEKIEVDDDALEAIAHHVAGGMRDAVSLLDQLRSLPHITRQDVKERIGETGHEYIERTLQTMEQNDRAGLLQVIHDLENAGVPLETFVRLLLGSTRDRLHEAVRSGQNAARLQRMQAVLLQTAKDLRIAPIPGLVLESALLSLCEPVITAPTPAPTPHTPQMPPASTPAPQTIAQPTTIPGTLALADLQRDWTAFVQDTTPAAVKMSLKNGQLHAIEGNTVLIRFSSSFHRDKVMESPGIHALDERLSKQYGQDLRIKCVLESDVGAPPPLPDQDNVNVAEAALEVF